MKNRNHNYFSLPFHTGKYENERIQFLITKRVQNEKPISLLKTLHVNSFWMDLQLKTYFSLTFCTEKLKKSKISFLVTKSGQNSKAISLLKTLDVSYM